MLKKLIILAIIIVLIAGFLSLWNFLKNNNSTAGKNIPASQNQLTNVPSPTGAQDIMIQNPRNEQQISDGVRSSSGAKAISQNVEGKNFSEFQYKDASGNSILLDDFMKANKITISQGLKTFLDQKKYSTIYCTDNNRKDYGLIFNVRPFGKSENVNFATVEASAKKWENDMLRDLQPLLYPQMNFNEQQLNQTLKFTDGKYRYTNVILPDGSKGAIDYKVFGSQIVVVSSLECMDKVSNYFSSMFD